MIFYPTYNRKEKLMDSCSFLEFSTEDGIALEGVIYEPLDAKKTILFFGGKHHDVVGIIEKLAQSYPHFRIISFNYRSYGKSQGKLDEKVLLSDGLKIADVIEKNYGDFLLVGYSLGSVVASFVASKKDLKDLVLLGAFDSLASLVKSRFFNISYLLRYKLNTVQFIYKTDANIYIFASKSDEVVPIENTRKLKKSVKNLAFYEEFEHLSHKEILWDEQVIQKITTI